MPIEHAGPWYSLIAASPIPEVDERVNVALLTGNGRLLGLDFEPKLPRLACIVAPDEIGVYEAVLRTASNEVAKGILDPKSLEALLGVQFKIGERRRLLESPSPRIREVLRTHYLAAPVLPYIEANSAEGPDATTELDRSIAMAALPFGVQVVRNASVRRLYDDALEGVAPARVPRVSRTLRGRNRDVFIDSVRLEPGSSQSTARSVGRVSRGFFTYARLAEAIRVRASKETRRVGVVYAEQADATGEVRELTEWAKHILSQDASRVIDASETDVNAALAEEGDWVAAA